MELASRRQVKRARRHSFSSLEESTKEMEAGSATVVSKEQGRKRCLSPSLSEGSSPKRPTTGTCATASSDPAGANNGGRMAADLACLPLGERAVHTYRAETGCSVFIIFAADPAKWTVEQVSQWLGWAQEEFGLDPLDKTLFNVDGERLCSLTREEFIQRSPQYTGDVLYSHLCLLRARNCEYYIKVAFFVQYVYFDTVPIRVYQN